LLISQCGGDIQMAEDALQDACIQAAALWQNNNEDEQPKNPGAWLFTIARRRLIDQLRQSQRHTNDATLNRTLQELTKSEDEDAEDQQQIPDERLKLIFTCCHPALTEDARLALTLKTLCGLSVREIARAFLVSETAMNQRLVRAKRKIKAAGIKYKVPDEDELSQRLDSVLTVIYLIFNESYSAYEGLTLTRDDLGQEAIRLAQVLHQLLPSPEVAGLQALMLLHQSRNTARSSSKFSFIPLEQQDRRLWDQSKISVGRKLLLLALAKGQPGKYQIQASISALHAEAGDWLETDWQQILLLYLTLLKIEPSAIIELNMLVALAQSGKPKKALVQLDSLQDRLHNYQPFFAARANIQESLGLIEKAKGDYRRAIMLSKNTPERDYLQRRLRSIA
jgi:RNA polymerase sigma-70 factor (ECF subfamily)